MRVLKILEIAFQSSIVSPEVSTREKSQFLRIDSSSRVTTNVAFNSSFDKSNFSCLKKSSKLESSSLVISIDS